MIAISLRPTATHWETMSFPSTLYLAPVLDLLLSRIPAEWKAELRLGLQEALVNAAKHGNQLDPEKQVMIQFSVTEDLYSWIITDQGSGFTPRYCSCPPNPEDELPPDMAESGRGLCILYQIFDQVNWNKQGTQLKLCKQATNKNKRQKLW